MAAVGGKTHGSNGAGGRVRIIGAIALALLRVLGAADHAPGFSLQYLNRLSDLLFGLARVLNREARREDVMWQRVRTGNE